MAFQDDKKKMSHQDDNFDSAHNLNNLTDEEKQRMREGYSAMGKKGGQARAKQLGHDGYVSMGHKGGVIRAEKMAKGEYQSSTKKSTEKDKRK